MMAVKGAPGYRQTIKQGGQIATWMACMMSGLMNPFSGQEMLLLFLYLKALHRIYLGNQAMDRVYDKEDCDRESS